VEGARRPAPGREWDGHVLLLHSSEEQRRADVTAWVRRGLERGEKVVYTQVPGRPADSLVAVLEPRGVDAEAAVRDGRLVVLPPADFFLSGGPGPAVERALADGFAGVRMSAEVGAALSILPAAVHRWFEQGVDEQVRTRPVHALCQYAQTSTTGQVLDDVVALHLLGVRQATFSTGWDGDGLVLRGEVDPTNSGVFAAALAAAARTASRVLRLDLTGLGYLDAGSCWALDDVTRRFRAAGGQVLLVGPPPAVERTMRLLEIDELPGVHLAGGQP
jgi:anti-anti-sigma regulatory factor